MIVKAPPFIICVVPIMPTVWIAQLCIYIGPMLDSAPYPIHRNVITHSNAIIYKSVYPSIGLAEGTNPGRQTATLT